MQSGNGTAYVMTKFVIEDWADLQCSEITILSGKPRVPSFQHCDATHRCTFSGSAPVTLTNA